MLSFFNPFRRGRKMEDGKPGFDTSFNTLQGNQEIPVLNSEKTHPSVDSTVPETIQQLLAIQERQPSSFAPVASMEIESGKVKELLEHIMLLSTSPWEDQQIALALISRLEALHQAVVHDLHGNPEASHQLITRWSVDADRLMHARNMLGNVDLG
jgi:hypothetical protein